MSSAAMVQDAFQAGHIILQMLNFFFGKAFKIAAIAAAFEFAKIADAGLNRLKIGQHAA